MARRLLHGGMPPMPPPSSSPPAARARSRGWAVALGVLALLAGLVWAFDWNWLRPAIRHYVLSHSGRRFDCDDLKVSFHGSLDPTIEMRNLVIQNAPWAASQAPFIRAGLASATISWRTIGTDMLVIEMLTLRDAQVDMERKANGIRNWRLGHPDDTGPPRARVLALDAQRSSLHTVEAGLGLVGDATMTPLAGTQAAVPGHTELPLTKHLVFDGSYRGHAFAVDGAVSDVLAFGGTARVFALRGNARLGGLRLDAQGVSNDAHALGDLDVDASLASSASGPLWPLPEAATRARPFAARGHLVKAGTSWKASGLQASLGHRTRVAGELRFSGSLKDARQRRILDASLHDAVLDVDDLRTLAGKPSGERAADDGPALPATPLPTEHLRDFDADIDLHDARILASPGDLLQTLRLHATLAAGQLRVSALDLGAADGHVTGSLQFDSARRPDELALDLRARGLDLARLSPKLARSRGMSGRVDAQAQLKARGDSARALAGAAAGSVSASLAAGASVSKRLDAKLSLDGGEWLRSLLDKSDRVAVQCAAVTFDVAQGRATSRRFVFETERTALAGRAVVDLPAETLDATITPTRKTHALLALDKSVHASGPWRDLHVRLEAPAGDTAPERCAATPAAR